MNKIPFFTLSETSGKYQARRPLTEDQIIKAAKKILCNKIANGPTLDSPRRVKNHLIVSLSEKKSEVFACLFYDNQHRVIKFEEVFQGTIDSSSIYPREVVRRCIELNASAVIFAHNHPSGSLKPSFADKRITVRLAKALSLIDVRSLDHIIVGGGKAFSFAERGIMPTGY